MRLFRASGFIGWYAVLKKGGGLTSDRSPLVARCHLAADHKRFGVLGKIDSLCAGWYIGVRQTWDSGGLAYFNTCYYVLLCNDSAGGDSSF